MNTSAQRTVRRTLTAVLFGALAFRLHAQATDEAKDNTPTPAAETKNEVVELPAFSVQEDASKKGYQSTLVVGANRMVVPIEKMDGSAFVINQELIKDTKPRYLNDVVKYVAGVEQNRQYGPADSPVIRGRDGGTNLVDGMELGISIYMPIDFVQQYEIIKGAQGVMYGQVSGAGVINRVMKQPQQQAAGEISGSIGSYGYYHGMVDLTGPVAESDKLSYRVVSLFSEGGGRQKNLMTDHPEDAHLGSVSYALPGGGKVTTFALLMRRQWTPASEVTGGDPVTGLFDEDYAKEYSIYESLVTDEVNKTVGVSIEKMIGPVSNRVAYRYLYATYRDDALFPCCSNSAAIGVEPIFARYQKWVDNYSTFTYDGVTTFDFGPAVVNTLNFGAAFNTADSSYIQLLNYGPNFEYGYYNRNNPPRGRIPLNLASPNMTTVSKNTLDADYWSVYGNWRLSLAQDRVSFIAGVRYQDYEVQNRNLLNPANVLPSKTGSENLMRGGVVVKVTEGLNAYAGYGETFTVNTQLAYIPPGSAVTNGSYLPNPTSKSEEVGLHWSTADKRFNVQAAYYKVSQTGRTGGGQSSFQPFVLLPDNSNTGVELQFTATPIPGWNVIASATKAKIRDVDGRRSTDVAEDIANFWTKYTIQEGTLKDLGFGVGMNHWGDKRPAAQPSGTGGALTNWMIPAVTTYDAAVSYRYGKHWDFALNVENVADKLYVMRFGGLIATWFDPGRKWTCTASYSW